MKFFTSALASMAAATPAATYDVSHLPNGVYKVPISDNGVIDYANAINLNLTYSHRLVNRLRRVDYRISSLGDGGVGGSVYHEGGGGGEEEGEEEEEDGYEDEDENRANSTGLFPPIGAAHCHWHYPHFGNRFITGHTMMNMTNYPLTLAMFMDWMSTGADGGWLQRGEVRMAKSNDVVVGACVFTRRRLITCVHELSLAMQAADRECAAGKVGCHVCLRHWHKDYFRFAASEAPNQCECAWYYG